MEAAKGNITTEKKDNNIASKIENITKKWITSRHYHVKKWMENRNTPGKEGRKNYGPNRSNAAKRLGKIEGGTTETLTDYNSGEQK